tara:strand:+ start:2281 stop:2517 length:237 start_codon:yes stop_codon:yes gene_type:complete
MEDHNSIQDDESREVKWDRAKTLFLESLYKPDHELRGCAHNQKCYNELMEIRDWAIEQVKSNIKSTPFINPWHKDEGI